MNQNRFSSRRRGGFMTIGLILCMILALTVAGVLWNYQYLTIQNVEMECAARSAIQAAINDSSIGNVFTSSTVTGSTLETVLDLTQKQQSGAKITVSVENSTNKILKFTRSRQLGAFGGVLKEKEQKKVTKGSLTQYYQVNELNSGFVKYYQ